MQTLKFIGRGSAFNIKEGNNSAYITYGGTLFLIDCGESIFERIIKLGLLDKINKIEILITHLNSDHVGSLSSLIFYCQYVKKIEIMVSFPTLKLAKYLKFSGNDTGFSYRILGIDYDNRIGSINVKAVETTHIEDMECYSYLLTLKEGTTIFYSGDSNKEIEDFSYDQIYVDTCLADYPGNVHLSLKKLCECVPSIYRDKFYVMHVDCDELIDKAKEQGFNVVETVKYGNDV